MFTLEQLQDMVISEHGFWVNDTEGYISHKDYYKFLRSAKRALVKPAVEWYFITINPKPEADLKIFMKLLTNFVKRKPVSHWFYNIEQRGETVADAGRGFHSHLLVAWDKKQNKYLRQFCIATFKRVIGKPNDHNINIRRIGPELVQDKLDYLNGEKWDVEKDEKLEIDKIFRLQNNISILYKNALPEEASNQTSAQTQPKTDAESCESSSEERTEEDG